MFEFISSKGAWCRKSPGECISNKNLKIGDSNSKKFRQQAAPVGCTSPTPPAQLQVLEAITTPKALSPVLKRHTIVLKYPAPG